MNKAYKAASFLVIAVIGVAGTLLSVPTASAISNSEASSIARGACSSSSSRRLLHRQLSNKIVVEVYRRNSSNTTLCAITVKYTKSSIRVGIYTDYQYVTRQDSGNYSRYAGPVNRSIPVGSCYNVSGVYADTGTGAIRVCNILAS